MDISELKLLFTAKYKIDQQFKTPEKIFQLQFFHFGASVIYLPLIFLSFGHLFWHSDLESLELRG